MRSWKDVFVEMREQLLKATKEKFIGTVGRVAARVAIVMVDIMLKRCN